MLANLLENKKAESARVERWGLGINNFRAVLFWYSKLFERPQILEMSSVTYASFPRKKKGEENPTHMHGKGRPLVLVLTSLCKSTVHGNTFCRSSNKKVPPMQRWLLVVLLAFVTVAVTGMPYQVPMQGVAGGKRTLVLVDDMVS